MFRQNILLISCLGLSVFAQAAPFEVSRIFCYSSSTYASGLASLRSDSSPSYRTVDVDFTDTQGRALRNIESPTPVTSNNFEGILFFISGPDEKKPGLYLAHADYPMRRGSAELFSAVPAVSQSVYKSWNMTLSRIAVFENKVAYSKAANVLEVIDWQARKTLRSWKINGIALAPIFSPNGQWLAASVMASDGSTRLQIFSMTSSETLSIPSARNQQMNVQFVGNESLAWTEGSIYEPASEKTLELKAVTLSQLRAKKSPQTLVTRKVRFLRPFIAGMSASEGGFAALTSEQFPKSNSSEGPLQIAELEKFSIKSDLKISTEKIRYSEELINLSPKIRSRSDLLLSSAVYSPYSDQIIFSLSHLGGVASYSLQKKQWGLHGNFDIYKCYSPVVGPEVTHE